MNTQQYVQESEVLFLIWLQLHHEIKTRSNLLLILFPSYNQKKIYLTRMLGINQPVLKKWL
jgi:hypothetical protein